MSRWTLAKKFWVREIRSASFPCLLFWQCKLWFCSDMQIPRGVEWENGDLRGFYEVLEEQWKIWCENGKAGEKKEKGAKYKNNFSIKKSEQENSLPAYHQYTLKFKKKAIMIMKWSRSKVDIKLTLVFKVFNQFLFPVCHFFIPT